MSTLYCVQIPLETSKNKDTFGQCPHCPYSPDGPEYCVVPGNGNWVVRNGVGKEPSLIKDALYQQRKDCPNNNGENRNK